ncbi:ISSth5 transposase [Haemophilus aegyptius ATCC 11116]|nr:ISSth5 transposase [Haemophilus aegyptius ATCC 11116]
MNVLKIKDRRSKKKSAEKILRIFYSISDTLLEYLLNYLIFIVIAVVNNFQ